MHYIRVFHANAITSMFGYKSPAQFFKTYTAIAVFVILTFIVRLAKFNEFSMHQQLVIAVVSLVLAICFWESLRLTNYWLNKVYPFEKNIPRRIAIQLALGVLIGVTLRFIVYFWGEPHVPFKLDSLFLAATWALYVILPTVVNLGFFTLYFIDRWKVSIIRAERLEKEKSQVQFDNLKNQLNPHFLFNALTSLNSLIFENQQLASEFLQQLSKVYRYVLQHENKNFVLLRTEVDFIAHYIQLLETRFRGALTINVQVSEEAKEKAIVPVTLQILIENAIKHNVADKDRKLTIDVISMGDYLVVSNNLQVRRNVETSNKQGLENLKSLYKFLTEKPVIIEPTDQRFYVKVPLL
jgi:two-component system, LytTR family, sensor kinase